MFDKNLLGNNISDIDKNLLAQTINKIDLFFAKFGVNIDYDNSRELFENLKIVDVQGKQNYVVSYDETSNTIKQNFENPDFSPKRYEAELVESLLSVLSQKLNFEEDRYVFISYIDYSYLKGKDENILKEEINKIPKKIKLLEEYKYLYKNLDDLVEKTEKMKEISNKRVQELSARDKKYKDAKNKIVNLEEVENCCNLIIEKNNNYLEELSKKVDKISERKYVESKLKGMNGFLTSSLRYIWLLSLTPLRGILPGIGARTVATRKLLHNMLKNMHYEKQEKIIYSLGNYESEINNKIYDIDSLNYNIDLALEDVQKLKKEFKDYFLSYSFKEYDKAYKKIELIEKNIIDNKNKVYLIKEKLIKSKELNRNTLTKVKKLNDKN